MVEFLRKFAANKPKLKKVLSFIYRIFVEPIISGYLWYMIKYFLFTYKKEICQFKKLGFENVGIYLSRLWRRGTELDHAHRRYYKALFKDKAVFIKVAQNDATIENEIVMAEKMENLESPFIMPSVLWKRDFRGDMKLLAVEFVDGLCEFKLPDDIYLFDRYCAQYIEILNFLGKHNIVHADIHPKNLMVYKDNKLMILDFGISGCVGERNTVDYIARPGTHFREEDGIRIYDDAYSFVKMCERLDISENYKVPSYNLIEDRIDKIILEVKI